MITYKRLYDESVIKEVLTAPEMWERISEYGQEVEEFSVPIVDFFHWVGAYRDNTLLGILSLHPENATSCTVHINVIKEYRAKFSKEIGYCFTKYMLSTQYDKFNTQIPVIYPNVTRFVQHFGFKIEGINRLSINKGGYLVDQHMFGITRQELQQVIKGV